MKNMFKVRSPQSCTAPRPLVGALPVHVPLAAATAPCPPVCASPHLAPRCINALFSTPQYAKAFNQPPSFDTSRITHMGGMFRVRSAKSCSVPPALL